VSRPMHCFILAASDRRILRPPTSASSPDAGERELFASALKDATPESERAAWRTLAHALLALNEFLYVD
ncbi:MAG: hypothetical protein FJ029_00280, partial [Actinobacteria bacterium]|nr:hypothetical protein [Actinomycetota bacterium]